MPSTDKSPEVIYLPNGFTNLPPDCELRGGRVVRVFKRVSRYGDEVEEIISIHDVAPTIEEAREKRIDFYDPERGWLLEGWKWQSDPRERGLDTFTGQRLPSYIHSADEARVIARGE